MNRMLALGIGMFVSAICSPLAAFALTDVACSITATPSRAAPGERVTLTWNTTSARSASLSSFGPVPLSGSRVIQASQTTDYSILVSGYSNNYVGCVARLTVVAKQPTCNISLVPFAVASGSFATLSWSTEFADSVYISTIGNVQPSGNTMVKATGATSYSISARGPGGFCERTANLDVRDPYQAYGYFPSTAQSIAYPLFGYQTKSSYQPTSYNYQSSPTYTTYSTYETYDRSGWDDRYDDVYDEFYYTTPTYYYSDAYSGYSE